MDDKIEIKIKGKLIFDMKKGTKNFVFESNEQIESKIIFTFCHHHYKQKNYFLFMSEILHIYNRCKDETEQVYFLKEDETNSRPLCVKCAVKESKIPLAELIETVLK